VWGPPLTITRYLENEEEPRALDSCFMRETHSD